MITIQKYIRPQSLDEAYQLNQSPNNRIAAGMLWLKTGTGNINTAIDLSDLGLNTIDETETEFKIGAMVSLRQIEQHIGLNTYSQNAVSNAVKDIVGVQFRNMATIGGSIWGRYGFSDVLSIFLCMDSYVELYNGGILPLETFAKLKPDKDILVRLIVKKTPGRFVYTAMRAQRTDFPVLTCAVSKLNQTYFVAIGARPSRAILIKDEQNILADGITEETAQKMAEYVAANTPTTSNIRGSSEYRTHLAKVLTCRNLIKLGGAE